MSGVKYERDGYVVSPSGHKKAGWGAFLALKGPLWGRTLKGGK